MLSVKEREALLETRRREFKKRRKTERIERHRKEDRDSQVAQLRAVEEELDRRLELLPKWSERWWKCLGKIERHRARMIYFRAVAIGGDR